MITTEKHQQIIDKLYGLYQTNGYISEEDALDAIAALKLPLHEIDIVSEQLLAMGAIIRTEPDVLDDDEEYDRSQLDYNSIFNEVVSVDPSLDGFINQVRAIQPPQHREWRNLIPQAKCGNQYAFNRLLEMYSRVVIKIALWHHQKYDLPLADTVQDGFLGLMTAIDKFEFSKHDLFTTYAPWWIRQAITRAMPFSPFPLLYYPAHFQEKLYLLYDTVKEYKEQPYSLDHLINIVCQKLNSDEETARTCLNFYSGYISIENSVNENEELFNDNGLSEELMFSRLDFIELRSNIEKVLNTLKSRERSVLEYRTGLLDGKPKTLEEIGEIFGLTRERIRQIEAKAIRRLKHHSCKGLLINFFE